MAGYFQNYRMSPGAAAGGGGAGTRDVSQLLPFLIQLLKGNDPDASPSAPGINPTAHIGAAPTPVLPLTGMNMPINPTAHIGAGTPGDMGGGPPSTGLPPTPASPLAAMARSTMAPLPAPPPTSGPGVVQGSGISKPAMAPLPSWSAGGGASPVPPAGAPEGAQFELPPDELASKQFMGNWNPGMPSAGSAGSQFQDPNHRSLLMALLKRLI